MVRETRELLIKIIDRDLDDKLDRDTIYKRLKYLVNRFYPNENITGQQLKKLIIENSK